MFGSYLEKQKGEPGAHPCTPLLMPKALKPATAEPFVLLTGGEAATSSLITSPQTWGSLINPSEGMIYCFRLRPLMDRPSSAEAETPQAEGASPSPPAVNSQLATVPLVGLLAQLGAGVRPGPILYRRPLLTYHRGKIENSDTWCCRGTGHAHALLAEVAVSVHALVCAVC